MNTFCKNLHMNKVKETQEQFKKLDREIQELLLYYSWKLLKEHNYNQNSYWNSFKLFRLFRNKDMKELKVYKKYDNSEVEKEYKIAYHAYIEFNKEKREKKGEKKDKRKRESKSKYEKRFQKYKTPHDDDSVRLYYISLYEQNPESKSAIRWLTEYGLYDGKKRKELEEKYSKIML